MPLLLKPWKDAGFNRSLEKSRWKTLDFPTLYTAPPAASSIKCCIDGAFNRYWGSFFLKFTHYKPGRPIKIEKARLDFRESKPSSQRPAALHPWEPRGKRMSETFEARVGRITVDDNTIQLWNAGELVFEWRHGARTCPAWILRRMTPAGIDCAAKARPVTERRTHHGSVIRYGARTVPSEYRAARSVRKLEIRQGQV